VNALIRRTRWLLDVFYGGLYHALNWLATSGKWFFGPFALVLLQLITCSSHYVGRTFLPTSSVTVVLLKVATTVYLIPAIFYVILIVWFPLFKEIKRLAWDTWF
jgi:uncharacterized membrane protein YjjP (DUF1212 family)